MHSLWIFDQVNARQYMLLESFHLVTWIIRLGAQKRNEQEQGEQADKDCAGAFVQADMDMSVLELARTARTFPFLSGPWMPSTT
jgi:hypothetical protein